MIHCCILLFLSLITAKLCSVSCRCSAKQGLKLHLPGHQCKQKSSASHKNFAGGCQHATNIAMANNDVQRK